MSLPPIQDPTLHFDGPHSANGYLQLGFREDDCARIDRLAAVLERLADLAEEMAANTRGEPA